jgi:hypothetical protein
MLCLPQCQAEFAAETLLPGNPVPFSQDSFVILRWPMRSPPTQGSSELMIIDILYLSYFGPILKPHDEKSARNRI